LEGRSGRDILLEGIQTLSLGLAIVLLFLKSDLEACNGLVLAWLVIGLCRRTEARPWSLMLLGLLLLNVRGIVLDEGTVPVSPVDYILLVAAFLCGYGRPAAWWLRQASLVGLATLIGVLLQLEVVVDFARFNIEYAIAALTKNQTALLAGLACLGSLLGGLAYRSPLLRMLHGIALAASVLLLRAADSRAGLGITFLAILGAGLLVAPWSLLVRAKEGMWRWRRPLLLASVALVACTAGLWLLHHQAGSDVRPGGGPGLIDQIYGEENLENDAARLNLWGCYFGLPFTGDNRFIWGVGYEKAWRFWCDAEKVGRPLRHAHNLILQVWAENGVSGAIFLLGWLGWTINRSLRNVRRLQSEGDRLMVFAGLALLIYLIGFNLFELGMMKVPLLLFFFGLFLASPFFSRSSAQPEAQALNLSLNPSSDRSDLSRYAAPKRESV